MIVQNPKYKPLYTTDKRYILLTGGRGSGKSHSAATFLNLLTYEKKRRILFTRYTMTSAEISIIPEFKDKIDHLEVTENFIVNSNNIKNKLTDSEILFRGIKTSSGVQTANLKSLADVSCWCNDESEELTDENVFDTIDLSIRTHGVHNIVMLLMNPSNRDHWAYKRWIANTHRIVYIDGIPIEISTHPDVLHIHTSYLDNLQHLDKSFLNSVETMKREQPKSYAHKMIGQWLDVAEGSLFPKKLLKTFEPTGLLKFDNAIAYIDVADEGKDSLSMFIGKPLNGKLYITDIVFTEKNTDISLPLCAEAINRNSVSYCRVESNSMGAMFARNLKTLTPKSSILTAHATTNKHTRIIMDSVFINETFIYLAEQHRSPMYEAALTQMSLYVKDGSAKHDDAADCASGLAIFYRALLGGRYV